MSEDNGTFICEPILHRYICLPKTTKNNKLWLTQKFPRTLLSSQWSVFETSRIIIKEVWRFCIHFDSGNTGEQPTSGCNK